MIPYFCGNEEFCGIPSERAFDKAVANVRKHYLIVGVLEDYLRFLKLSEILLPIFFRGSVKMYFHKEKALKNYSATGYKEKMDEPTRSYISQTYAMKLEIKFYKFVLKRFNQQCYQYNIK